jgi:uncharacterized protein DUF3846
MVKCVTITTDNVVTYRDVDGLTEMKEIVGGWIEAVQLGDGSTMYLNEEGRLHGLPVNLTATNVCGLGGRPDLMLQGIVGDVFIVGPTDPEGNDTDLTEAARNWVTYAASEG